MPKHAQLTVEVLAVAIHLNSLVHTEILVVTGQYLHRGAARVVVEDEVLQQVEEVLFLADAAQHGRQLDVALLHLVEAFPLVEKLPLRVDGAHPRLQAVAEHDEGIVVEQLRDGVEIVAVVHVEGIHHFHIVVFQLHEKQGDAVDEAHDVGTAAIEVAMHPQLTHAEELVLIGRIEVDDLGAHLFGLAGGFYARHGHTVPEILILLLVDLHQRLAAHAFRHALHGFLQLLLSEPRVEGF